MAAKKKTAKIGKVATPAKPDPKQARRDLADAERRRVPGPTEREREALRLRAAASDEEE